MKSFEIAGINVPSRYVLAPLAGYTDYSFRKLSSDYGAGLVYTEMESCESLFYKSMPTRKDVRDTHLDKQTDGDTKVALQIFGGKKDIILKSIPLFEQLGDYDFLDFNCGCPVPKVIRQHAGSAWLNRQDELVDLMAEIVKLSSKPVIIKLRIGFDSIIDIVSLCKRLENVGVRMIAVHGRTRSQFFSGDVRYDIIKDIKDHLSIPVLANGSITPSNFQEVLDLTKADGVMVGQKAIGNPKVFQDMCRIEEGLEPLPTTLEQTINDLEKHLDLIYSIKDERNASSVMRSISVHYMKGFDNAKKYRVQLVHCEKKSDYFQILESMRNEQKIA